MEWFWIPPAAMKYLSIWIRNVFYVRQSGAAMDANWGH